MLPVCRDPDNKWYESRVVEVDAEGDPELVTVGKKFEKRILRTVSTAQWPLTR